MAQNREPFLSRWSRRKRASADAATAPPAQAEGPPPELPPIDSLTPESDFSAFMHKKVDEKLRRAALAKLFSDPAFNLVDGLDDYAEDYTQLETLAEGVAATLEHAKRTLRRGDAEAETNTEPETLAQAEGGDTPPAEAEAIDSERPANEAREANAVRDAGPDGLPPPADPTAAEKR
jgi:hypothetical protein